MHAAETTIELRSGPAPGDEAVEVVERKGLGHPDTLCDAIAERAAVALAGLYVARFGEVLHHNVDKALLVGGASRPRFGGGEVLAPIEIDLAGRATREVGGVVLPVEEVVHEAARAFLRASLHALDADRHVVVRPRLRGGSADLRALFARGRGAKVAPRANDTSIGVGSAPLTPTERVVLAVDAALREAARSPETTYVGEDVKLLAVRRGRRLSLTVACAIVDRGVRDLAEYEAAKARIAAIAADAVERTATFDALDLTVDAADDPARGELYLTVTGTSAEAGDDGEVGRGNRVGGLITPGRPMTMEAVAGKNAVTHVGKLYNVLAREIAADLVSRVPGVRAADVLLASCIGAPIDQPAIASVRLSMQEGAPLDARARAEVRAVVDAGLDGLGALGDRIVAGELVLF